MLDANVMLRDGPGGVEAQVCRDEGSSFPCTSVLHLLVTLGEGGGGVNGAGEGSASASSGRPFGKGGREGEREGCAGLVYIVSRCYNT